MSSASHNHSYMEKAVDVNRFSYLHKLDSFICSFKMTTSSLEPLECLLNSIVSRLEVIESKLGVIVPPSSNVKTNDGVPAEDEEAIVPSSPALVSYDEFLAKNILPLMDICLLSLEDAKMKEIGEHAQSAFEAIRHIILF